MANAVPMKATVATRLDFSPRATPTIEWPLVQPPAQRAPYPTSKPPAPRTAAFERRPGP